MDRYRIRAMVKLIESSRLSEHQLRLVIGELSEKCAIYGKGCLKRGKAEEGEYYLQLPEKVRALQKPG
jgi:hypothetical protein